jgi:hypothetical protein
MYDLIVVIRLILPLIHSERSRKSVWYYWGAKLWNTIPTQIRNVTTLAQFTTEYEIYLWTCVGNTTDSYYYSVICAVAGNQKS